MARAYSNSPPEKVGELIFEEYDSYVEIFYIPPADRFTAARIDSIQAAEYKTKILSISEDKKSLTIFPIRTFPDAENFLKPKYETIQSITLKGFYFKTPETTTEVIEMLEELPSGFIKDYDYGLGLQKDYRFIVDAIEEIPGIKHLIISKNDESCINAQDTYTLSFKDFDTIRKNINTTNSNIQSIARRMKGIIAYNFLAHPIDPKKYPQKTYRPRRGALDKLVSSEITGDLAKPDQEYVINLVSKNAQSIAESQPETLIKLHNNIELVTLEQLIEKFKDMLGKKHTESSWQKLFNENPFILSLAFGYPVIKIQDQAHVGGRKIEGSGEKITDFLVKNGISNNAALFEIKTPATKLLQKTPYREDVYTPSSELSGSINQMLDQKCKFQQNIAVIKNNSRIYNLESYAVHGVLVIGETPTGLAEQKSFELFRGNSKDIFIITFDELLVKLTHLHHFLSSDTQHVS